jgi:serine/threonine-protein kinase HipA
MAAIAKVRLWGRAIGAVSLEDGARFAQFEYEPAFAASGVEPAPLTMPVRGGAVYDFPALAGDAFGGLPGMLADSLPDRYGNALIDAWLASQGRPPESLNAVERLCYVGTRGMGALEFEPTTGPEPTSADGDLDVGRLVVLATAILSKRDRLSVSLAGDERERAMQELLSVGTSAGGARPKAVVAWNHDTHAVRSGQVELEPGFEHWLLKFDGVEAREEGLGDPQGYGAVELAYSRMARDAGIEMPETHLLEEGGRRHFMAKRFDRTAGGAKLHMQSLAALAQLDFNQTRAHSYEQAFLAIRQLDLGMDTIEEQFRRMTFNVLSRNQDDHVKNIAFLMGRDGRWSLAPAFDVTYSFKPGSPMTGQHQMSVNGKRDDFALADLRECARTASMARGRADEIVEQVAAAVARWPELAGEAAIPDGRTTAIASNHRRLLG